MIKQSQRIIAASIISCFISPLFAAPLLANDPEPNPSKAPLPTLDELLGLDEPNAQPSTTDSSPTSAPTN